MESPSGPPTTEELVRLGREAGLVAVGVAPAEVLQPARDLLVRRKAVGLAADMQFTYRNPERSTDPKAHLPSAVSMVAGAWSYRRQTSHSPAASPEEGQAKGGGSAGSQVPGRIARYVWRDHYQDLRRSLGVIADRLKAEGYRATVLADTNHLVDRNAAWLAGLGWYGKNANLLIPEEGSWVVLGAVLTNAELDPTGPPVVDGCGPCRRCIDGCPTGAIVAPGVVDAGRCLAWLVQAGGTFPRQWREALGDRIYGCDDCQEVCPPNRPVEDGVAHVHQISQQLPGAGSQKALEDSISVDLLWLLSASDEEILERHGSWYIADRDLDHLRRSALVALGNSANPQAPEVRQTLEIYLAHPRPLLRAHAVWAARRLGLDDLAAPLAADPDPDVQAEARLPVSRRFTADGVPV